MYFRLPSFIHLDIQTFQTLHRILSLETMFEEFLPENRAEIKSTHLNMNLLSDSQKVPKLRLETLGDFHFIVSLNQFWIFLDSFFR